MKNALPMRDVPTARRSFFASWRFLTRYLPNGSLTSNPSLSGILTVVVSIIPTVKEDFQGEDWVSLYHSALIELEHARMAGRIIEARTAIVSRMEKLTTLPGLHPQERRAIEDALRSLRLLEKEDARLTEEEGRRSIDHALEKLRSVKDSIERWK
jgi:hypothetical protein